MAPAVLVRDVIALHRVHHAEPGDLGCQQLPPTRSSGLTGVGAGEITSYSFWCVEKGHAAWTGPDDGSEAWVRRARGWISVMKKDAWVAWVVYTLSTASFYVLGAAVLNPQGLAPSGNDVLTVISRIFTDTAGQWAGAVFLAFAALALFKTVVANVPSLSRRTANSVAVFGAFDWHDPHARGRWMGALMIVLPIAWGLLGVVANSPLALVIPGGILNALYLLVVATATPYLSFRETDPRIEDGPRVHGVPAGLGRRDLRGGRHLARQRGVSRQPSPRAPRR